MNGAECGDCGRIQCVCNIVPDGKYADFQKATEKLYEILIKPKGLRLRFLRWLFPELADVANELRKCYWN